MGFNTVAMRFYILQKETALRLGTHPDDKNEFTSFLSVLDNLMAIDPAPCRDIMCRSRVCTINL
jgi:hypothetical protein